MEGLFPSKDKLFFVSSCFPFTSGSKAKEHTYDNTLYPRPIPYIGV